MTNHASPETDVLGYLQAGQAALWEWDFSQQAFTHMLGMDSVLGYGGVGDSAALMDMADLLHPADMVPLQMALEAAMEQPRQIFSVDVRIKHASMGYCWFHVQGMLTKSDPNLAKPSHAKGLLHNIQERKLLEIAQQVGEERWQLVLSSVGDGIWDLHVPAKKLYLSNSLLAMYGYAPGDLEVHNLLLDELTHPDDLPTVYAHVNSALSEGGSTFSVERRMRCKDGSWKWVMSRGAVVSRDAQGKPLRLLGTHTDITQRKKAEETIRQQALYDSLTGLPNRRMLRERIEYEIDRCQRVDKGFAVLFIDLDRFKEVNDTLGHDSGDTLLVQAAQRLRNHMRASDTVARMGGDEFTILLTDLYEQEDIKPLLDSLLKHLESVYELAGEQAYVSASIGVAVFPGDGLSAETLYKHADEALYVAKSKGRNQYCFFTPDMHQEAMRRSRLTQDLRVALQEDQFKLVYQPIVDLRSGVVHKVEALLRWQHPQLGFVSPADFVPLAESTGRIVEIGNWVFEQAADQALRWRSHFQPDFQISINCSPVQFYSRFGTTALWLERLGELGLPGQAIVVEITEGMLLDNHDGVHQQLLAWGEAGVQVALDDFGTGYSSLSYLQKFDIDFIKIDQSFVRNLQPGSTQMVLCRAMITMAHALGLQVVAEGVETAEQCRLLMEAGCDYAQGYYFARPMDDMVLELWLREWDQDPRLPGVQEVLNTPALNAPA
ncbi:EAL domain-containing protein [Curvibacter sp. CHRR-16]|uniref:putative bifunctional diguanylate cyclase/phosphodiesterase n=1 Tax=Curvibacter sp. CHRR-16 TaxID=2835872 RepID=UPI001BD9F014|nr:GGDEF and EAL domain-containing protein [Curvibacter sp. CHRR-16]MBT0570034.1 EAL domain-containing protein [Curvibacter sp. CHRR-16]